ncbi:MAG: phosphotransferase enzyme family protein [Mucilaginibacter sp.]
MLEHILKQYGINAADCKITEFGSGLINHTWRISGNKQYILQQINTYVFRDPGAIARNLHLIDAYLKANSPYYLFVAPLPALNGEYLVQHQNAVYRLSPFIENSVSVNEITNTKQAYEAARQFGLFTLLLKDFDATSLKCTIPGFHDLSWRYEQFLQARKNAAADRLKKADEIIKWADQYYDIVTTYQKLVANKMLPVRVIHHDAKINNVLFDPAWNGLAVIDLDTVMPGYFISDVGDMLRTYLSPANEEETDLNKIVINENNFYAVYDGYSAAMGCELTAAEKEYFIWAGKFMIYMQAVRFLTDYLSGDKYYHITYGDQNLNRTANQLTLLERLITSEKRFVMYIQTDKAI